MDTSIVVTVNRHASVSRSPDDGEAVTSSAPSAVRAALAAASAAPAVSAAVVTPPSGTRTSDVPLATLTDDSPQALAQAVELATLRARVRALATALVGAQEAAHRHVARELHDSAGAELTVAHYSLSHVDTWLPADAPTQCVDALAAAHRSLEAVCETTRRIVSDLHGPALDAGLVNALSQWTREFSERTGLRVTFDCAADKRLARLPADASLAVFRVAQEALNNVAKHARASGADVRLEAGATHLTLSVIDDGIGNIERRQGGQFGIGGMRARCEAYDGVFHIDLATPAEPRVRRGTTVRASFAWKSLRASAPAHRSADVAQAAADAAAALAATHSGPDGVALAVGSAAVSAATLATASAASSATTSATRTKAKAKTKTGAVKA